MTKPSGTKIRKLIISERRSLPFLTQESLKLPATGSVIPSKTLKPKTSKPTRLAENNAWLFSLLLQKTKSH